MKMLRLFFSFFLFFGGEAGEGRGTFYSLQSSKAIRAASVQQMYSDWSVNFVSSAEGRTFIFSLTSRWLRFVDKFWQILLSDYTLTGGGGGVVTVKASRQWHMATSGRRIAVLDQAFKIGPNQGRDIRHRILSCTQAGWQFSTQNSQVRTVHNK